MSPPVFCTQWGLALYLVQRTYTYFGLCLLYRAMYPDPAVRIFCFHDGGDVTNPAGLSPCILPQKCKSGPMPQCWRQKSANPTLFSRMSTPYVHPGMAADKCITHGRKQDMKSPSHYNCVSYVMLPFPNSQLANQEPCLLSWYLAISSHWFYTSHTLFYLVSYTLFINIVPNKFKSLQFSNLKG